MQSFASLPLRVERPQPDGPVDIDDHPMAQLLRNPAPFMDGDEFARELILHLMTSGNAYIEKGRDVRSDGVRIAGQVQSLGLIRPDYVEIIPGATRADDQFKVTVEGVVKAVLPRSEVIQIKLPNPFNDFYGMSPMEVIRREGSIDLHMSDFELAFFRNAGVPYGMLMTHRNYTADQREDAQGAFRRAMQGFNNWWNLLIINADEATYEQMGLANSDMEMDKTRDLVETRITAAYGVPAVIAGALVGLKNSPWSEMKTAYRKFWSDTMIPMSKLVAAPLARELLPELAVSADANAVVRYGFEGIEALREDHTERANGAATLINTGGVTVQFAFTTMGLTPPPDSDFFVPKTGSVQTEDVPAQVSARSLPLMLAPGRKDALDDAADERTGILDRVTLELVALTDDFEPIVADVLAAQGQRVLDRFLTAASVQRSMAGGGTVKVHEGIDADLLVTEADLKIMIEAFTPSEAGAVEAGWAVGSSALGNAAEFSLTDPNVQRALTKAGSLIQSINDETRSAVTRTLQLAHDRGYSIVQIADGVAADDFPGLAQTNAFSPARARTIARTEMANAQGAGSAARYREAEDTGLSVLVRIADGDGCGWLSHDDPDKADGKVVTIQEYEDHTTSHPNCVRAPIPVVQD